jgi:hypothetical protein
MSGKKLLAIRLDPRCLPPAIPSKALQDLPDELEPSRASRKRAWEILREIRWVLKDAAGMELPPPARKTIDLEGRLVKDAVRKALRERQTGLTEPCPRHSRVQEAGP